MGDQWIPDGRGKMKKATDKEFIAFQNGYKRGVAAGKKKAFKGRKRTGYDAKKSSHHYGKSVKQSRKAVNDYLFGKRRS